MTQSKKTLSVKQICSIINSCYQNGVSKFSYGDITLEFHPAYREQFALTEIPEIAKPTSSNKREIPDEDLSNELDEGDLSLLDVMNPRAFEEHLLSGDIAVHGDED